MTDALKRVEIAALTVSQSFPPSEARTGAAWLSGVVVGLLVSATDPAAAASLLEDMLAGHQNAISAQVGYRDYVLSGSLDGFTEEARAAFTVMPVPAGD